MGGGAGGGMAFGQRFPSWAKYKRAVLREYDIFTTSAHNFLTGGESTGRISALGVVGLVAVGGGMGCR